MNKYEEYLNAKNWDITFRYMLLDRMRSDCDYFLGYGRFYANHLWAGNVVNQIGYMKALWESFPAGMKPEWLTMKQIINFEKQMQSRQLETDYGKPGIPVNFMKRSADYEKK